MEQLSASVDSDDLASNAEFELLVQEAEGMEAPQPGDDKAWESVLLDLVNGDQRLSPAEINRKRKRLTFQSFRDPLMVSKVLAIESLVGPNVRQMHRLFSQKFGDCIAANAPASGNVIKLQSDKGRDHFPEARESRTGEMVHCSLPLPSLTFGLKFEI